MRKPLFITGDEAAAMIQDDSTIATIGMTLVSASETMLLRHGQSESPHPCPFLRAK